MKTWLNACIKALRKSTTTLIALSSCVCMTTTFANPVLDSVTHGNVSVQQTQTTTTVNQQSQKAILNWQSFNIGTQEHTHFQQPVNGIALNRINPSQGVSQIYGRLTATGQIILVNPAGFHFGPSAYVNVGGLIASTANISNEDFLNDYYRFANDTNLTGFIHNQGRIIAADHGLVALVGGAVRNDGMIQANMGTAILASGNAFTMSLAGYDLIHFSVDEAVTGRALDYNGNEIKDGVRNTGTIMANGGQILVSAKAAAGVLDHVINMEGIAEAKSVEKRNGALILRGDNDRGIVRVAAKIDASGKNADQAGGRVEITGYNILLNQNTIIDASGSIAGGTVNIGGNYLGQGPLPNANAVVMADASIYADAIEEGMGGRVILWSDHFTNVSGDISVRGGAASGDGGFIETSSKQILNISNLGIDTSAANGNSGLWLLDPANINISTANNNITGSSPFTATAASATLDVATLVSALGTGNVVVQTSNDGLSGDGDITVSSGITWTSANTLSLNSFNKIVINAPVSGINGSLHLTAATDPNSITTGPSGSIDVNNFHLLQGFWYQVGTLPAFNVSNNFQINFSVIADEDTQFIRALSGDGTFGLPYVLTDVYGLQGIGSNLSTYTKHYRLGNNIDATSTSNWNSGAGFNPIGDTNTTIFTGSLDGRNYAISNLYINRPTERNVALYSRLSGASLKNTSLINPNILGLGAVSGFSGFSSNTQFSNLKVIGGSITGISVCTGSCGGNIGAIAGWASGATIDKVYNSSAITGRTYVGGLVGYLAGSLTISNSYNTGTVFSNSTQNKYTGGLVGLINSSTNTIINSYNSGLVHALNTSGYIGGIAGSNSAGSPVISSYWDTQTSGQSSSAGGTGKTTAQMQQQATYVGWDFVDTWDIVENFSYPGLEPIVIPPGVTFNGTAPDAGQTVWLYSNGDYIGDALTYGTPGNYTFTFDTIIDGVAENDSLLFVLADGGNSQSHAALTAPAFGTVNDVSLDTDNTITIIGSNFANSNLATATPVVTNNNDPTAYMLYSASGNDVILGTSANPVVNLVVETGTTYDFDSAISTTSGGTSTLSFGGNATLGTASAIDVSSFMLTSNGQWNQIEASLPSFNTSNDFRIADDNTANFIRVTSGDGSSGTPYVIIDVYGLQGINSNNTTRQVYWQLGDNVSASGTRTWNDGTGFMPIGYSNNDTVLAGTEFTGNFNGVNYAINNLYINNPTGIVTVGLFGATGSGTSIQNVSLSNVDITGTYVAGGLVGNLIGDGSTFIANVGVTGNVAYNTLSPTYHSAGGLIGSIYPTYGANTVTIQNSYSTANVDGPTPGSGAVGGFIGYGTATGQINIINSYSSGRVGNVGGFAHSLNNTTITNSFWDTDTSGLATGVPNGSYTGTLTGGCFSGSCSNGGTANLSSITTYQNAGWSINNNSTAGTWVIFNGATRPMLSTEYATNGSVSNPHQLQLINTALSTSYTLANDIDMSNAFNNAADIWGTQTSTETGDGFIPIGNSTTNFTGSFTGQGNTIDNLYINRSLSDVALFGQSTASISDLSVTNATITSDGASNVNAAILVGRHSTGNLSNLRTSGNVSVTNSSGEVNAGGIIGLNYSDGSITTTINHADVLIDVSSNNTRVSAGGFAGTFNTGTPTISVSYNAGNINVNHLSGTADIYAGGLIGYGLVGNISNVYNIGHVTGTGTPTNNTNVALGGMVGSTGAGISFTNTYNSGKVTAPSEYYAGGFVGYSNGGTFTNNFFDSDTSGGFDAVGSASGGSTTLTGALGQSTADMMKLTTFSTPGWDINATPSTSDVAPTETWFIFEGGTRPILMFERSTEITNAHQLQLAGTTVGAHYILANDIDLMSAMSNTSEIWGTDRNTTTGAGFFPIGNFTYDFNATFNGLNHTIDNLFIRADAAVYTIGLFGVIDGDDATKVSNLRLTNLDVSMASDIGYEGWGYVGGLGGYINADVDNVYLTGVVSASSDSYEATLGAIAGEYASYTVSNVYSDVDVISYQNNPSDNYTQTGGLFGSLYYGVIENTHVSGDVINNNLLGSGSYAGGIAGYAYRSEVINSYTTGDITSIHNVGGIYGYGSTQADITNSYATGNITGNYRVGGLVGESYGVISNSYASGNVTASILPGTSSTYLNRTDTGGLVGYNRGTIQNSYSIGTVSGENTSTSSGIGGLVGQHYSGSIIDSYSTSPVTGINGSINVGGFVGRLNTATTFADNYWDIGTSTRTNGVGSGSISGSRHLYGGCFGNTTCNGAAITSATNAGGSPVDLTLRATFGAWSITDTPSATSVAPTNDWFIFEGNTRPVLTMENNRNVTNAHELQLVSIATGGDYTLANDIDLTGPLNNPADIWGTQSSITSGAGFVPIGSDTDRFKGTFDGQNHTVNGLYYYRADSHLGLFGNVQGEFLDKARIENLGITNANVTQLAGNHRDAGILVGHLNTNTIVDNTYSTGTITSFSTHGEPHVGGLVGVNTEMLMNSYSSATVIGTNAGVGGLVGYNDKNILNSYATGNVTQTLTGAATRGAAGGLVGINFTMIDNSFSSGTVNGQNTSSFGGTGGLVGYNTGDHIRNSYSTGNVVGGTNTGGLTGLNDYGEIRNTYSTGSVTGGTNTGGFTGYSIGMDIYNSFWDVETSGQTAGYGGDGGFVTYTNLQAGCASASCPTQTITNATNAGVGVTPVNLLSYSTYSSAWGTATGETAGGITKTPSTSSIAPDYSWFSFDGSARPMLMMENTSIIETPHQLQMVGAVLGSDYTLNNDIDLSSALNSTSSVNDVWATNTTSSTGNGFYQIGGTTAFNGTFDGQDFVIDNLYINNLSTSNVGLFNSTSSNATISNLGLTNVAITTGPTGSSTYTGGITGYNSGTITDSYVTGTIIGRNHVGGIAGRNDNIITNSYNKATVDGYSYAAGIAGSNAGSITNTYNTGDVTGYAYGNHLGGITGHNTTDGEILRSFNSGNVHSVSYSSISGGIAAENNGVIGLSYNTGQVTGQLINGPAGGVAGMNTATGNIYDTYNTGHVMLNQTYVNFGVGGLVGENAGSISNSYSIGYVKDADPNSYTGGYVGSNSGTITNSFWDTATSGYATANENGSNAGISAGCFNATTCDNGGTVNLAKQASFTGWDFDETWGIIEDKSYPYLKAFYSDTTRIVSGDSSATVNTDMTISVNATVVDTTKTFANGFFYRLYGLNNISGIDDNLADGSSLLLYQNNTPSVGNVITHLPYNNGSLSGVTGLTMTANSVTAGSAGVVINLDNNAIKTAKGFLTDTGILYSVDGSGNITLSGNTNFITTANTTYTILGNISTASGNITLNGPSVVTVPTATLSTGGSGTINILNNVDGSGNALVISNADANSSVSGILSNLTTFTKSGTGTLTLTGNNTYSGTTVISDGALQIGNNGTTGTLGSGNVTNNSLLIFNRSDDITVGNLISGTGAVTKLGNGILILTGANSYAGLTTLSAGTITVNNTTGLGSTASGTVVGTGTTLNINNITVGAEDVNLAGSLNGISIAQLGGDITLAANSIIDNTGGTFTLGGTINGAQTLTFNGAGTTLLNNTIGDSTRPTNLTANTDLAVSASSIQTSGNQLFTRPVTLNGPVLFDTNGTGIQSITFTSSIAGGQNLTLNGSNTGTYQFTINGINANDVMVSAMAGSSNNLLNLNSGDTQNFNITGIDIGDVTGITTVSNFDFDNIGNFTGGAAIDTFTLSGGTLTGSINGGLGMNTLTGDNVSNTWMLNAANGGSLTGISGSFSNIQNLTGGSANDIFTIAGGSLGGNIDGGLGDNTLVGGNTANTWTINVDDGGSLTNIGGTFSNIQNLTGGTGVDAFNFSEGVSISGMVNGGDTVMNQINFDTFTSILTLTLSLPVTTVLDAGVVNYSGGSMLLNFSQVQQSTGNSLGNILLPDKSNMYVTFYDDTLLNGEIGDPFYFYGWNIPNPPPPGASNATVASIVNQPNTNAENNQHLNNDYTNYYSAYDYHVRNMSHIDPLINGTGAHTGLACVRVVPR